MAALSSSGDAQSKYITQLERQLREALEALERERKLHEQTRASLTAQVVHESSGLGSAMPCFSSRGTRKRERKLHEQMRAGEWFRQCYAMLSSGLGSSMPSFSSGFIYSSALNAGAS